MDCSPPGSSVHDIFQARVLEWGAIAFSGKCLQRYINVISIITYIGIYTNGKTDTHRDLVMNQV